MFGGVLSVLLASLTCQLPEICEAPVTGVPDTSSIFGEEISRQLQSLYQEKQEAPSVTFTLTLMICPRPGFSRGSGCNAPDHTPVQLIITSAPPLATWQQRTEQVAWEGVRALVSPAPSFPLSSALLPVEQQGGGSMRNPRNGLQTSAPPFTCYGTSEMFHRPLKALLPLL